MCVPVVVYVRLRASLSLVLVMYSSSRLDGFAVLRAHAAGFCADDGRGTEWIVRFFPPGVLLPGVSRGGRGGSGRGRGGRDRVWALLLQNRADSLGRYVGSEWDW